MIPNWLQCRREINQGAKLAYARLAQYAGRDGECYPRQQTLAAELGVSERTANEYIRTLVKFRLIEKERPGLGMSNRYYFLDHPWIHEGQPEAPPRSGPARVENFRSRPARILPVLNRRNFPLPMVKRISLKENQREREHTHSTKCQ